MVALPATGFDGLFSLEIFSDRFRAGAARGAAMDGRPSSASGDRPDYQGHQLIFGSPSKWLGPISPDQPDLFRRLRPPWFSNGTPRYAE
jgi:hypothetical protein